MFSTRTLRGFVAAAVIAALPVAAFAQNEGKMAPKMEAKPAAGKMAMDSKMGMKSTGPVYVCKDGKMYYSAADAKKMGYKDPMGGKLKKMGAPPKGGMMMHADSKMMSGKMMGGKMEGSKMMGDKKMEDKKMGGDKPKM